MTLVKKDGVMIADHQLTAEMAHVILTKIILAVLMIVLLNVEMAFVTLVKKDGVLMIVVL